MSSHLLWEVPPYLREFLWQSTACLLFGVLVSLIWRKHPSRSHRVLLLSVMACFALPFLSLAVRKLELGFFVVEMPVLEPDSEAAFPDDEPLSPRLHVNVGTEPSGVSDLTASAAPLTDSARFPTQVLRRSGDRSADVQSPTLTTTQQQQKGTIPWKLLLVAGWGILSALALGRLLFAIVAGSRVLRRSRPLADGELQALVRGIAKRLGIMASPSIRVSEKVSIPIIWCWGFHPNIVFPRFVAKAYRYHRLFNVLYHELAHWKRKDHLTDLAASVLFCVLPWHPLVLYCGRRMKQLSEEACDDWVLASGIDATDYAECLLEFLPGKQVDFAPALAFGRSKLGERIHRIMYQGSNDPRVGRSWAVLTAIVSVCIALCLAFAQERPLHTAESPPSVHVPRRLSAPGGGKLALGATEPAEQTAHNENTGTTAVGEDSDAEAEHSRHVQELERRISDCLESGELDEAVSISEGFKEYPLAPEGPRAYLEIAKAAWKEQRASLAIEILKKSIRIDPYSAEAPESHTLLAEIHDLYSAAGIRDAYLVRSNLCINYFPYNKFVMEAKAKVQRLSVAPPPTNRKILLDSSLGESSTFDRFALGSRNFGQYDVIRILSEAGYVVHVNDRRGGAEITLTRPLLEQYGLVILNGQYDGEADPPIPEEVIDEIAAYVEAGGALLVTASSLGKGETAEFYNPLIKKFGFEFVEDSAWYPRLAEGHFAAYPAVDGLEEFFAPAGVPVHTETGRISTQRAHMIGYIGETPVLGVAHFGAGKVVVAGIGSGFMGATLNTFRYGETKYSRSNSALLTRLASYLISSSEPLRPRVEPKPVDLRKEANKTIRYLQETVGIEGRIESIHRLTEDQMRQLLVYLESSEDPYEEFKSLGDETTRFDLLHRIFTRLKADAARAYLALSFLNLSSADPNWPPHSSKFYWFHNAFREADKNEDLRRTANEFAAAHPHEPRALAVAAEALSSVDDYRVVSPFFDDAIAAATESGDLATILKYKGRCLASGLRNSEAIESFRESIAIELDGEAVCDLMKLYGKEGLESELEDLLEKSREWFPEESYGSYDVAGRAFMEMESFDLAEASFHRCLALLPRSYGDWGVSVRCELVEAYARAGRLDEARRTAEQALALSNIMYRGNEDRFEETRRSIQRHIDVSDLTYEVVKGSMDRYLPREDEIPAFEPAEARDEVNHVQFPERAEWVLLQYLQHVEEDDAERLGGILCFVDERDEELFRAFSPAKDAIHPDPDQFPRGRVRQEAQAADDCWIVSLDDGSLLELWKVNEKWRVLSPRTGRQRMADAKLTPAETMRYLLSEEMKRVESETEAELERRRGRYLAVLKLARRTMGKSPQRYYAGIPTTDPEELEQMSVEEFLAAVIQKLDAPHGLSYRVKPTKAIFSEGEPVLVTFVIENVTAKAVELRYKPSVEIINTSPSALVTARGILVRPKDAKSEGWMETGSKKKWQLSYPLEESEIEIDPGAVHIVEVDLRDHYDLPPGRYTISSRIDSTPQTKGDDFWTGYALADTESFEVE